MPINFLPPDVTPVVLHGVPPHWPPVFQAALAARASGESLPGALARALQPARVESLQDPPEDAELRRVLSPQLGSQMGQVINEVLQAVLASLADRVQQLAERAKDDLFSCAEQATRLDEIAVRWFSATAVWSRGGTERTWDRIRETAQHLREAALSQYVALLNSSRWKEAQALGASGKLARIVLGSGTTERLRGNLGAGRYTLVPHDPNDPARDHFGGYTEDTPGLNPAIFTVLGAPVLKPSPKDPEVAEVWWGGEAEVFLETSRSVNPLRYSAQRAEDDLRYGDFVHKLLRGIGHYGLTREGLLGVTLGSRLGEMSLLRLPVGTFVYRQALPGELSLDQERKIASALTSSWGYASFGPRERVKKAEVARGVKHDASHGISWVTPSPYARRPSVKG